MYCKFYHQVSLTASYHKEQEYIWFRGGERFLKNKAFYEVRGVGHALGGQRFETLIHNYHIPFQNNPSSGYWELVRTNSGRFRHAPGRPFALLKLSYMSGSALERLPCRHTTSIQQWVPMYMCGCVSGVRVIIRPSTSEVSTSLNNE